MRPYQPLDLRVGLRCMAPVKRANGRALEDVEVVWVSRDGHVAEVQTVGKRRQPLRQPFACSLLRRPGTVAPETGVYV